jgi:3'-phosphoadenosine 5'-phosphosulfate sulfotransferase (PAPS reductase)/FAD synthetase
MEAEFRHEVGDLEQLQSLPLSAKIKATKVRIRQWYETWDGNVHVSFSGGKDSTVLLHLVRSMYPDVPAVFCDTGLEYPELKEFVNSIENVTTLHPKLSFRQVIEKYGYPVTTKEIAAHIYSVRHHNLSEDYKERLLGKQGRCREQIPKRWLHLLDAPFEVSSTCCDVMKKRPFHAYEKETGSKPFIGTLAEESDLRRQSWLKYGCNAFDQVAPKSRPLSFWTASDVLEYLVTYDVPYASVYGDIVKGEDGKYKTTGVESTGCIFCAFGAHREGRPNRFQRMKKTHPKLYEYCMKPWSEGGLGLDAVLTYSYVRH